MIEASRLALSAPLMGGDAAASAQMTQVSAGSVSVAWAAKSVTQGRADRLALVNAMLRSLGVGGASGLNVGLRKS